ncbi:MAG TPA: carboxypeptidase-like regulatory domain-containing protein [Candidatus Angelobacter sp.]|nr:carboxypeptidase-like regulatory domain-containing protein [Candidatus Angelobacter sp.]
MKPFTGFSQRNLPPADLVLSNIRIASPCPTEWSKMIGDERVRHCSECNLNVYNLSAMTEREVKKLIEGNRGQRLCARMYRRADGTVLTQDCPWGWRAMQRRISRVAGVALTFLMSVGVAVAKTKPQQDVQACTQRSEKEPNIALTVMDQDGAVIPNAEVLLELKDGKERISGKTGALGQWSQSKLQSGSYVLTVNSPGFQSLKKTIHLVDNSLTSLQIKLPLAEARETVIVEAQAGEIMGEVTGTLQESPSFPLPMETPANPTMIRR